jgi:hypothetical protein
MSGESNRGRRLMKEEARPRAVVEVFSFQSPILLARRAAKQLNAYIYLRNCGRLSEDAGLTDYSQ